MALGTLSDIGRNAATRFRRDTRPVQNGCDPGVVAILLHLPLSLRGVDQRPLSTSASAGVPPMTSTPWWIVVTVVMVSSRKRN